MIKGKADEMGRHRAQSPEKLVWIWTKPVLVSSRDKTPFLQTPL